MPSTHRSVPGMCVCVGRRCRRRRLNFHRQIVEHKHIPSKFQLYDLVLMFSLLSMTRVLFIHLCASASQRSVLGALCALQCICPFICLSACCWASSECERLGEWNETNLFAQTNKKRKIYAETKFSGNGFIHSDHKNDERILIVMFTLLPRLAFVICSHFRNVFCLVYLLFTWRHRSFVVDNSTCICVRLACSCRADDIISQIKYQQEECRQFK